MRQLQVKSLGFMPVSESQAVSLLMEEAHTEVETLERLTFDYHYRHHEGKAKKGEDCTWGITQPNKFLKKIKKGSWFLPPFQKTIKWEVEPVLDLDKFKAPFPDYLLKAINYFKTKGVFNCYRGFQNSSTGEAVMLGCVEALCPESSKSSDSQLFLLGFFGAKAQ